MSWPVTKLGVRKVFGGLVSRSARTRAQTWDSVFLPIREPDWWQGDAEYHAPAYTEPVSNLERRLRAGEFVVTAEVAPPMSSATGKLIKNIQMVKPYVAAINFTDNPSATPRMSSVACSTIAVQQGAEPVMQIAARDRTRMGLQSEVIGASALGVRNILCLSGDHARMGPPPLGRSDVLDIDSIQMLWILRRIRDEGKYLDGRTIKETPKYFLGAAASPFASEPRFQAIREHKKINAGAQFFQPIWSSTRTGWKSGWKELAKRNILDKVFILIGITPLKSLKMAQFMNNEVPGVTIPEPLLRRLEAAGDGVWEEGVQIALELIEKIKGRQGIHGIHIMAVGWEGSSRVSSPRAGLLPKDFASAESAAPAKVPVQ
jgi:methylenetetrahydrofolate reductase (NADPH)